MELSAISEVQTHWGSIMTSYTLYVDESGDVGLGKERTATAGGASPYFTLGAVLVADDVSRDLREHLNQIAKTMSKDYLHCQKLTHRQKVYYAREMSNAPIVFFGVISMKGTLGKYKDDISGDPIKFFNKCAQYLLERVGAFMKEKKVSKDDMRVIFEDGLHDYPKFRSFIKLCQSTPKHPRTALLQHLNIANITDAKKADEPLFQVADLVAHSLFSAVDKTNGNFQIPEPRYLNELHKRFYHHERTKEVVKHGIWPIHELDQIGLDEDIFELMASFRGNNET